MGNQEWIRLWRVTLSPFEITFVENVASNHERTVNVVRFSQSGEFIASGADDHCVMILEKKLFLQNLRVIKLWIHYVIKC